MSAFRAIAGRLAGAAAFVVAFVAGSFVVPLFAQWSMTGRVLAIAGVLVAVLAWWLLRRGRAVDGGNADVR